jgi:hypothetical protein
VFPFYAIAVSQDGWFKALVKAGIPLALAVGIARIYWIPLHVNLPYMQSHIFTETKYFYGNNFWTQIHDLWFAPYVLVGLAAWVCRASLAPGLRAGQPAHFLLMILLLATIVWFMTTPPAKPLWAVILLLPTLQFPFRFYAILSVFVAMFAALLVTQKKAELFIKVVWPTMIVIQTWFIFAYAPYDETGLVRVVWKDQWMVPPALQTIWSPRSPTDMAIQTLHDGATAQPPAMEGTGSVDLRHNDIHAHIMSDFAVVHLKRYYFYNLRAQELPQKQDIEITPDAEGFATIRLPRGDHTVQLYFTEYKAVKIGAVVSALSLATALLCGVFLRRRAQVLQ